MKFTQLISYMGNKYMINSYQNYYDSELNDMRLIDQNQNGYEGNTLYVGLISQIKEKSIQFANIILSGASSLKVMDVSFYKCNIILFKDTVDIHEVFNYLNTLFMDDISILKDTNTLLKSSVIRGYNLKYLTSMCSKMVNNPIFIIDKNYKLLEYSTNNFILKNTVWDIIVNKKGLTGKLITELSQIKTMRNTNSTAPFVINLSGEVTRFLISKVMFPNQRNMGFVACCEYQSPFTLRHYELLSVFSGIISDYTNKTGLNSSLDTNENIFYNLLSQDITNNNDILEKISDFNFSLSGNLYIIVIDFANYKIKNQNLNEINNFISCHIPKSISVYYDWNIVILSDFNLSTDSKINIKYKINEFAYEKNLYIGISNEFYGLVHIKKNYNQAISTIRLSRFLCEKFGAYNYNSKLFFYMLECLKIENKLLDFCHSAIFTLTDYDKENSTHYLKTLNSYIKNGNNIQETALDLFLHRNTLAYRLKKIEEICELNLKDCETVFQLNCSFKIIRYANHDYSQ